MTRFYEQLHRRELAMPLDMRQDRRERIGADADRLAELERFVEIAPEKNPAVRAMGGNLTAKQQSGEGSRAAKF